MLTAVTCMEGVAEFPPEERATHGRLATAPQDRSASGRPETLRSAAANKSEADGLTCFHSDISCILVVLGLEVHVTLVARLASSFRPSRSTCSF